MKTQSVQSSHVNQQKKRHLIWIIAVAATLVLVIVLLLPVIDRMRPVLEQPILGGHTIEEIHNPSRVRFLDVPRVVDLVDPKPGEVVLDLGAGYGLFTFPFAKRVGEEGKVFATDIEEDAIGYLREQARERGIENMVPVRVQSEGIDPFYGDKVFDVIFVCEALIAGQQRFFAQLAPSLRQDSGRLWLVGARIAPDFTAWELEDPESLVEVLRGSRAGGLLVSRMLPEVQALIAKDAPAATKQQAIIDDLNRLLDDHRLWVDLSESLASVLNQRERDLREYLIGELEKEKVFSLGEPDKRDTEHLRLLNRLVIQDILGNYVWEKAFSLDKTLHWDELKRVILGMQHFSDNVKLPEYEALGVYDILPYHRIWQLKRSVKQGD